MLKNQQLSISQSSLSHHHHQCSFLRHVHRWYHHEPHWCCGSVPKSPHHHHPQGRALHKSRTSRDSLLGLPVLNLTQVFFIIILFLGDLRWLALASVFHGNILAGRVRNWRLGSFLRIRDLDFQSATRDLGLAQMLDGVHPLRVNAPPWDGNNSNKDSRLVWEELNLETTDPINRYSINNASKTFFWVNNC